MRLDKEDKDKSSISQCLQRLIEKMKKKICRQSCLPSKLSKTENMERIPSIAEM